MNIADPDEYGDTVIELLPREILDLMEGLDELVGEPPGTEVSAPLLADGGVAKLIIRVDEPATPDDDWP